MRSDSEHISAAHSVCPAGRVRARGNATLCALKLGQQHPLVAETVLTTLENPRKSLLECRYLWSSTWRQSYVIWTSRLLSTLHIFTLWISDISPISKNYSTNMLHHKFFLFSFFPKNVFSVKSETWARSLVDGSSTVAAPVLSEPQHFAKWSYSLWYLTQSW